MPKLDYTRHVPFSARQMFDLVSDLNAYPDFVPNCDAMQVREADGVNGNTRMARMTIKFGPVTQAYTSRVVADVDLWRISAHAVDGPFSHLDSTWTFKQVNGGAEVTFNIDFNISNPLLAIAAEPAFAAKQSEILDAFMSEAARRYSPA